MLAEKQINSRTLEYLLIYSASNITYLSGNSLILLLVHVISFQKVYNSQNFWTKCTQKRNKLCSFSKRNLGATCHRTSLTI